MTYTDEQRAYHRAYYQKRRQKLLDYLGGVCVICGVTEDLHFDHVNPAEKSFNISANLTLNEKVMAELDKCQLLCETHHHEKTGQENSGYEHGTMYSWMKKKCCCKACEEAKQAYYIERNAARRADSGRGKYGRPAEHGEILMYRRGCKCVDCKKANAEYARSLRSK